MATVLEVISVLERTKITKEQLEATRLGKYINQLRRKTANEQLAKRLKNLLKKWREMVIPAIPNASVAAAAASSSIISISSPKQQPSASSSGKPPPVSVVTPIARRQLQSITAITSNSQPLPALSNGAKHKARAHPGSTPTTPQNNVISSIDLRSPVKSSQSSQLVTNVAEKYIGIGNSESDSGSGTATATGIPPPSSSSSTAPAKGPPLPISFANLINQTDAKKSSSLIVGGSKSKGLGYGRGQQIDSSNFDDTGEWRNINRPIANGIQTGEIIRNTAAVVVPAATSVTIITNSPPFSSSLDAQDSNSNSFLLTESSRHSQLEKAKHKKHKKDKKKSRERLTKQMPSDDLQFDGGGGGGGDIATAAAGCIGPDSLSSSSISLFNSTNHSVCGGIGGGGGGGSVAGGGGGGGQRPQTTIKSSELTFSGKFKNKTDDANTIISLDSSSSSSDDTRCLELGSDGGHRIQRSQSIPSPVIIPESQSCSPFGLLVDHHHHHSNESLSGSEIIAQVPVSAVTSSAALMTLSSEDTVTVSSETRLRKKSSSASPPPAAAAPVPKKRGRKKGSGGADRRMANLAHTGPGSQMYETVTLLGLKSKMDSMRYSSKKVKTTKELLADLQNKSGLSMQSADSSLTAATGEPLANNSSSSPTLTNYSQPIPSPLTVSGTFFALFFCFVLKVGQLATSSLCNVVSHFPFPSIIPKERGFFRLRGGSEYRNFFKLFGELCPLHLCNVLRGWGAEMRRILSVDCTVVYNKNFNISRVLLGSRNFRCY